MINEINEIEKKRSEEYLPLKGGAVVLVSGNSSLLPGIRLKDTLKN